MRVFLIFLLLLMPVLGCSKIDRPLCEKYCHKGISLAKQEIKSKVSTLSSDSKAEAMIFWKSKQNLLFNSLDQCIERCQRKDASFGSCVEKASNLDDYISCLK